MEQPRGTSSQSLAKCPPFLHALHVLPSLFANTARAVAEKPSRPGAMLRCILTVGGEGGEEKKDKGGVVYGGCGGVRKGGVEEAGVRGRLSEQHSIAIFNPFAKRLTIGGGGVWVQRVEIEQTTLLSEVGTYVTGNRQSAIFPSQAMCNLLLGNPLPLPIVGNPFSPRWRVGVGVCVCVCVCVLCCAGVLVCSRACSTSAKILQYCLGG